MLRHSAGALSLSSFGREKALKLERASVWTSRCCCCQLSTLDRTPEEKQTTGRQRQCGHAAELFRMSDFAVLKPNA